MIPSPSADFRAQEALNLGKTSLTRVVISPFNHPAGVDAGGVFNHTAFVAPGTILADYAGFSGGLWQSLAVKSPLGLFPSPAVISWDWNAPGFNLAFFWRYGDSLAALNAAAWEALANGDTLQIQPYYQCKLTLEGYRCWAIDDGDTPDDFTAYAIDSEPDDQVSYAAEANHAGDVRTYLKDLVLLGKFPVADDDIESCGTITLEAPNGFGELAAGSHSGLSLNNRQVDAAGNPAPLFTPGKSSFIFGNQLDAQGRPAWYGKKLSVQFGYLRPESHGHKLPPLAGTFTGITVWEGKIVKWGPPVHAADQSGQMQPHVCAVYARDWIADLFKTRLALPAADGTPQPLTAGEFLCEAKAVSGWSPEPVARAAGFERGNFNELDHLIISGGAAASLISPGLTGSYAVRFQTSGANQAAYGLISLRTAGEMFIRGNLRFQTVPEAFADQNLVFLQLQDAAGSPVISLSIDQTGKIYNGIAGQGNFAIGAYTGVKIPFRLWTDGANLKLWLNGDEVLTKKALLAAVQTLLFGAQTGGAAETWTVDFDDIEISTKYYDRAFKVEGGPFAGIGPVYVDNLAQPDSQVVGGFTQTLTRYPAWGMVQFTSTDPDFKPSGTVLLRVIETPGGVHAVDRLTTFMGLAGAAERVNVASFAAVKAANPRDILHNRLGDDGPVIVADAVKEICSRYLYWLVVDHGEIKLFAYDGLAPAAPVWTLTDSIIAGVEPSTDLDAIKAYVSATFGWYKRDPGLSYLAGDPAMAGEGEALDFTWDSPVASEDADLVKAKADLLLQFLSAQERWEPVRNSLQGARLELFDVVGIDIPASTDGLVNTRLTRKEFNLDRSGSPLERLNLQLLRFLGDS